MTTFPLREVLLAMLVGVICGADDWEGVEAVAQSSLDWLRGFLPFAADSDEAGHAFQFEAGHQFRSEAGHRSDLKPATRRSLPRIEGMMFRRCEEVKSAEILCQGNMRMSPFGGSVWVGVDNGSATRAPIAL